MVRCSSEYAVGMKPAAPAAPKNPLAAGDAVSRSMFTCEVRALQVTDQQLPRLLLATKGVRVAPGELQQGHSCTAAPD